MDTLGYYRLLCCTAGYCWLLLGTGWYWGVLWLLQGTGSIMGYWGVWGYLVVIEGSGGYSGVLWGTVLYRGGNAWYCWLLLVTFGYWVVLGGY